MLNPVVLLPEGFDVNTAWDQCGGHDPGVTSCPVCDVYYWRWGHVIQCQCGFKFPTSWYDTLRQGMSDRRLVDLPTGLVSEGMRQRCANDAFYAYGYANPGLDLGLKIDWRVILGSDYDPVAGYVDVSCHRYALLVCERCGKDKPEEEKFTHGICMACEAETTCKYRTSVLDPHCDAGVRFDDLRAQVPENTPWICPCYYVAGANTNTPCSKFVPVGIEALKAKSIRVRKRIERVQAIWALVAQVKEEHSGKDWTGVMQCPVCRGKLSIRHASYNGHVGVKCNTPDCISFQE